VLDFTSPGCPPPPSCSFLYVSSHLAVLSTRAPSAEAKTSKISIRNEIETTDNAFVNASRNRSYEAKPIGHHQTQRVEDSKHHAKRAHPEHIYDGTSIASLGRLLL